MATRLDHNIGESVGLGTDTSEQPCTLSEIALTVVGLLGFILIPALIAIIALKLLSFIVAGLGYSSSLSF
jgi:hypothetical protein